VRLRNLSFSYGATPVLRGISADFAERVTVLKGPSGCGKTTLLKLLCGFLTPDAAGTVDGLSPAETCLVLQEDALFPWLSGLGNILALLPIGREAIESHPIYPLVSPFLHRRAHQLSYGQRRKIELFRATLLAPAVLCLDEPFNFLDPRSREDIVGLFSDSILPRTRIVMTTHLDDDLRVLGPRQFVFEGSQPATALREA